MPRAGWWGVSPKFYSVENEHAVPQAGLGAGDGLLLIPASAKLFALMSGRTLAVNNRGH
ncbi:MAG: hypothetical protein H0X25_07950 [Acidobacteriales bacterium]|nr:hypothetical protein [Terriglobales bacterium]